MALITFVRHAESCSNIVEQFDTSEYKTFNYKEFISLPLNLRENIGAKISHPPLTFNGIQQAIILGTDYFNNIDFNYNIFYCSPSLRTIMTALISLRTINYNRLKSGKPSITLQLVSHLIELKNYAGEYDFQNAIIPSNKLQLMVEYIKWWFSNKWFENFIDYEFIFLINKLKTLLSNLLYNSCDKISNNVYQIIQFIKKIKKSRYNEKISVLKNIIELIDILLTYNLNLSIINEIKQINLKKFIDPLFYNSCNVNYNFTVQTPDIDRFIKEQLILKNNILCFSHGAILKKTFNLNCFIKNTEIINYDGNNITKINKHLNSNYKTCVNICGKLYDSKNIYLFAIINHLLSNKNNNLPVESLFYTNDNKFKLDLIPFEETDSFKYKYLKYKQKFLKLTNKN